MKVKLIIFDLDGTLINAYPAICESFHFVMKQMGLSPVDDEAVIQAVGWGERKLFEPFMEEKDISEALEIYRPHHVKALEDQVEYLSGAKDLLKSLKAQEYLLAVASNRPSETSKIILRNLGADQYFEEVLCGDMIDKFKPDPEILTRLMDKFNVDPDEAVYVGDMALDVETGRKAGVKTIAVTTGSSKKEEIVKQNPFRIVERVGDVEAIIEVLNEGEKET